MNWSNALTYCSNCYYTILLSIFSAAVFLVFGAIHYKKLAELKSLVFYSFLSFFQQVFAIYTVGSLKNGETGVKSLNTSINIFMLLEFAIFCNILFKSISSATVKRFLLISTVFFLSLTVYNWVFLSGLYKNPYELTVLEGLLIILPCLAYYYDLFKKPRLLPLIQEPLFWVATGMLIFFGSIIPLFLLGDYIMHHFNNIYNGVYSINFISYSLLFTCFLQAARCRARVVEPDREA